MAKYGENFLNGCHCCGPTTCGRVYLQHYRWSWLKAKLVKIPTFPHHLAFKIPATTDLKDICAIKVYCIYYTFQKPLNTQNIHFCIFARKMMSKKKSNPDMSSIYLGGNAYLLHIFKRYILHMLIISLPGKLKQGPHLGAWLFENLKKP